MTRLMSNALGRLPLSVAEVECLYRVGYFAKGGVEGIRRLAESHERLRAELQGSEVVMADAEKREAALVEALEAIAKDAPTEDQVNADHMHGNEYDVGVGEMIEHYRCASIARAALMNVRKEPTL